MTLTSQKLVMMLLSSTAMACSADDETVVVDVQRTEAALETQRAGSMLVEYNPALSNGVSVHAQFIEVRGVSIEAAYDALDVWVPDAALDDDACSIREPAVTESDAVRLHMLDVGPISVAALEHGIELNGRRVPDLASFSGVVYGNEEGFDFDQAFLPYQPDARYQISAPGGDGAGGFGVSLNAPAVPTLDAIAGHFVVDDEPIALDGGDLSVAWSAGVDERTALYLDVTHGTRKLQCRVEDDGSFVLPASALEQFPADRALMVTLRRVDQVELPIDGVEAGTFVFAAATDARITR